MASKLPQVRKFLPAAALIFLLSFPPNSARGQEIVAEPDLTLFTVMAALNAAGYDEGADRMDPASIRAGVRKDLEGRLIPSVEALRELYKSHRLADPGEDVSQYVSLALLSNGPPKFDLMLGPQNLPPDVAEIQEMIPLLASFYEQADIPALWNKYAPAMEQDTERYQRALTRVIQETNGYLRIETGGFMGLRFAVYLNPLVAPGLTDARNYGDNYYVVSSAGMNGSGSGNLPEDEIRHAWLHYLLDGYALKYPNIIQSKASLAELTQRAPALPAAFRSDFSLLVTESLVRAIQARLMGGDERSRLASVQDSAEEGYLLAPYFYDAMQTFVEQPVGMRLYFSEMVDAIDVDKEKKRLAEVAFRAAAARPPQEARWSPLEQMLRQAQEHMSRGEYDPARQIYESLTTQYGPQAAVTYGLAMIASQQKEPEKAKQYFAQAAALASDPRTKAWSHIYLGRILDLEGNRDAAKVEYATALSVAMISPETRAAAEQGLQAQFVRPGGEPTPAPAPSEPSRVRVPMGVEEAR
jgi:tetratricopeptide (TPR) repeat protein